MELISNWVQLDLLAWWIHFTKVSVSVLRLANPEIQYLKPNKFQDLPHGSIVLGWHFG